MFLAFTVAGVIAHLSGISAASNGHTSAARYWILCGTVLWIGSLIIMAFFWLMPSLAGHRRR